MTRLQTLMLLPCLALLCGVARAADTRPLFTLHHVCKGIWAAIDTPGSPAGSNSGFVIGDKAVLVVDSFEDPAAARALLKVIRSKTTLPVRYLINTHYHLDHVAGNGVYAKAGAVILAQRNVRAWERTDNLKFFGNKITPAERAMVASYVLPDVLYRHGITLYLGHRKVVVRVLPGHTGGDSIVVVPDAKVVFTGDLFWDHSLPNLIDADTAAQIHTNGVFLRDYPDATFVPGHGPVGHAGDVRAFRGYLVALRQAITSAEHKGEHGTKLQRDVLAQMKARYGSWNFFTYFAAKNIAQTVAELAGTKALPEPAP